MLIQKIRFAVYLLWQCTWGFFQTIAGTVLFLFHLKDPHSFYHGSVVTRWQNGGSISLGLFIFIADTPYPGLSSQYPRGELFDRLLVHEYGHTIQSLLLGPLYLLIIGLPSVLWANLPHYIRKRSQNHISYYAFFTEKWANHWGERVAKNKSMENIQLD